MNLGTETLHYFKQDGHFLQQIKENSLNANYS